MEQAKYNKMNEHAKFVYCMINKGHKKELGINAKFYHKLVVFSIWIIPMIIIFILSLTLVLMPIAGKLMDYTDDLAEKYKMYLFNKGIIYNKTIVWQTADISMYKDDEFVVEDTFDTIIDNPNQRQLTIKRIGNNEDFGTSWNTLGVSQKDLEKELDINVSDYINMSVSYHPNSNLSDNSIKLVVKHTYVTPEYWETEYGKKLLENYSYEYKKYVYWGGPDEKDDSIVNRTFGGHATDYFVSKLELELYV